MRRSYLLAASLAIALASPSAAEIISSPHEVNSTQSRCKPAAPNALIARPSDLKTRPRAHVLVAGSTLRLAEAKYVEGPCADDIVSFVGGNARLKSDEIFVVRADGKVRFHPPQGLVEKLDLPTETIEGLPGYRLVMVDGLGLRRTPAGDRTIFLGLFKGKSDSVIARFDVLNGKSSREAQILIRSRAPMASIRFVGAPDTPEGSIGFVQRVGKGKAWLYAYEWKHGDLAQLRF